MNQPEELVSLAYHGHKVAIRTSESGPIRSTDDKDAIALARSGKKQVLESARGTCYSSWRSI